MGRKTFYLLQQKRFLPLFLTQFFGAFNDNAFKLSMLTLISYNLSHSQLESEVYQALAAALFILPFFIFSASFGQIADKYDKAFLSRMVKLFEVVLMLIGSLGLYRGQINLLLLTLFGMGVHSSFFGPIKYAILPDHLPKEALMAATGLIEASTFLAILLGTTLGALAIQTSEGSTILAIALVLSVALFGLVASCYIPKAVSQPQHQFDIDWNVIRSTVSMINSIRKKTNLLIPIMAISWFWFLGSVILTKLPDYTHYVLQADNQVFALFLALFSSGIGCGSLLINRLCSGKLQLEYLPYFLMLLSWFLFDLYLASPTAIAGEVLYTISGFFHSFQHWRLCFDFFMLSFSAGLFVVPLYTYLQIASEKGSCARTIAVNNIYNASFMVIATLLVMLLIKLKLSIPLVFLIISILNLLAALLFYLAVPNIKK